MIDSNIEWTDATVNFWTGCKKVSPGCKFCYMYRDKDMYGQDPKSVIRTSDTTFYRALKWLEPRKIFTCSWSDFFIEEADQWRDDAWEVIKKTPQHKWQILTKRPDRITMQLPTDWGVTGYHNVWLGVSIEDQNQIDRMVKLASLKNDNSEWVAFLSLEPLLSPIDLMASPELLRAADMIDWVILGGESGNDNGKHLYRPSEIKWYRDIISQCKSLGIPVFVKQLGTHLAKKLNMKKKDGKVDRKGSNIFCMPSDLRIRQYPK